MPFSIRCSCSVNHFTEDFQMKNTFVHNCQKAIQEYIPHKHLSKLIAKMAHTIYAADLFEKISKGELILVGQNIQFSFLVFGETTYFGQNGPDRCIMREMNNFDIFNHCEDEMEMETMHQKLGLEKWKFQLQDLRFIKVIGSLEYFDCRIWTHAEANVSTLTKGPF